MSRHTPGKWITRKGLTSGKEVISPSSPKTKQVIARCGGPDRDGNADLIAAAPDLLAELEETHAALCFTADYIGSERHKRNAATIAKARGES